MLIGMDIRPREDQLVVVHRALTLCYLCFICPFSSEGGKCGVEEQRAADERRRELQVSTIFSSKSSVAGGPQIRQQNEAVSS